MDSNKIDLKEIFYKVIKKIDNNDMKVCFIPIKAFGAKLLALSLMIKNLC